MSDLMLRLYHHLPAPLRSAAATARGYRLRRWRYGANAEELVDEALDRERWSADKLKAWQAERLAFMLHRAATQVSFYRASWQERRRRGDRSSWEHLENWPLLAKAPIRSNPHAFVADDSPVSRLFPVNTSGTTGKPLRLWRSRAANQWYYAILEARFRRWHGVTWRRNWAILGGQSVVPAHVTSPPFWVFNHAMHQLYMSANHVSAANAPAYSRALRSFHVEHLVSYSSSAAELARRCLDAGVTYDGLAVIVTNAEPLLEWQRDVIQRAFAAPARETYGMVEIVAGASECPRGTLHEWPDLGFVEVIDDDVDAPVAADTVGRLVCTGLVNDAMPLIRYVIGDRASAPVAGDACPCGRTLRKWGRIEGRSNDLLIAADGRRVYWLNPVFYGLPVDEAQIVQESLDRVRISIVAGPDLTPAMEHLIAERLRGRLGDVQVVPERVSHIPRGPNGKFRAVVCNVAATPTAAGVSGSVQ